jgi:drug/metabolite transporter (DMT)-like permease
MSYPTVKNENLRCIAFMILAMAGFAIEDAVIKKLSLTMPVSQVLLLMGFAGIAAFGLLAKIRKVQLLASEVYNRWFIARTLSELAAAIFFVTSIVYASLSISSAILQATPLIVTLAGAMFLKQSVSMSQWFFILIGFLGVLLVIQPGRDGFQPAALFAVVAVFFLALRDTITRVISVSIPAVTISFWAFFALLLAGILTIPLFSVFVPVTSDDLLLLLVAAAAGTGAYLSVVLATRAGDVATVAPFRYTRLIFALGLAIFIFDETVNLLMLAGSATIIGSGIFMLTLERRQSEPDLET